MEWPLGKEHAAKHKGNIDSSHYWSTMGVLGCLKVNREEFEKATPGVRIIHGQLKVLH